MGSLPLSVDPGSLRVTVQGAELCSVRLDLEIPTPPPATDPSPSQVEKEIETELRRVEAHIAALQVERQAAVQLAPGWDPEGAVPPADRVSRWAELERVVGPWLERVDGSLREARRKREELSRRLHELAQATAKDATTEWDHWQPTQMVVLSVKGEGSAQVEITYRVAGARWSPAYVLDTDAGLRTGSLVMRALVSQHSGEDWSGVELWLASASSLRAVELPELLPFRMGAAPPLPPVSWRAFPADFDALFSMGEPEPQLDDLTNRPRVSTWSDDLDLSSTDDDAPAFAGAGPLVEEGHDPESWAVDGLIEEDLDQLAAGHDGTEEHTAPNHGPPPADPAGVDIDMEDTNKRFAVPSVAVQSAAEMSDMQETAIASVADQVTELEGRAPPQPSASPIQAAIEPVTPPLPPLPAEVPRPAPVPVLVAAGPLLEFSRLRLGTHLEPDEVRGRLIPADDEARLVEEGVSVTAAERLRKYRAEVEHQQHALLAQALPVHHAEPRSVDGVDVSYQVESAVDLPSDLRPRWVAVFNQTLDLEMRYTAVPRSDLRAYRKLRAPLVQDAPLLGGPIQVYVDGSLEATVAWDGSAAHRGLELSLGTEERITVARSVKYREEKLEAPSGARNFHTTVDVRVTSSLAQDVSVQLIERVPVPAEGNGPEVEITTSTPIARPYLGEPNGPVLQGAKVQTLDVPAEGEARAVLGYVIGLRTGQEIEGGDRRG